MRQSRETEFTVIDSRSDRVDRRVALVLSAINVRRLLPGMRPFVELGRSYWVVDIYRPVEDLRRLLCEWQPAGIIVEWISPVTEALVELGFPTVVAPRDWPRPGIASVDVDDSRIGRLVFEYFRGRGYSSFAFIGNQSPYSRQRHDAYCSIATSRGIEVQSIEIPSEENRQYIEHWHESAEEMAEWACSLPKPVGVFASHDPLGRALAECCRNAGLRIPDDVAIVGVNNDELVCNMTHPALSSVEIPWERIGFEAARQMEKMIEDAPTLDRKPVLIEPGNIVTRRSSEYVATESIPLRRAIEHIRAHACSGLRVVDLARELRLDRRRLERAFRREIGRSPRNEIIRHRVLRASQLLRETDLSMSLIAERSGFSSAALFAVNFKNETGETPSAHRRKSRLK